MLFISFLDQQILNQPINEEKKPCYPQQNFPPINLVPNTLYQPDELMQTCMEDSTATGDNYDGTDCGEGLINCKDV